MQNEELRTRLSLMSDAVLEAGRLAQNLRREGLDIDQKGLQDFVTQADRQVEALLVERLSSQFPEDGIMGEEDGLKPGLDGVWVIDPIDGTSNYIKGMDYWCQSVGYVRDGQVQIAAIYAPDRDEFFTAIRGEGAFLNGNPIQMKPDIAAKEAIIGLGMSNRRPRRDYLDAVNAVLDSGMEYRRLGAGALMLAHVASGQLDGYFEAHLNSWDGTAGILLIEEAGGQTNDFLSGDCLTEGNLILAGTRGIYGQLEKLLI